MTAPEEAASAPPEEILSEQTAPRAPTEIPVVVTTPAAEPAPLSAEQLDLQPQADRAPAVDVDEEAPTPQAEEKAPDPEQQPEPSSPVEEAAAAEDADSGGERLDARMEDVLSELERRYRGRRMGPGDAREDPDSPSRPRHPRPRR